MDSILRSALAMSLGAPLWVVVAVVVATLSLVMIGHWLEKIRDVLLAILHEQRRSK